jgi:hypothetical protein
MTLEQSAWAGMLPIDDTALYVNDTGGSGRPMVYLNGAYADLSHWRRVVVALGSDWSGAASSPMSRPRSSRSEASHDHRTHVRIARGLQAGARAANTESLVEYQQRSLQRWPLLVVYALSDTDCRDQKPCVCATRLEPESKLRRE